MTEAEVRLTIATIEATFDGRWGAWLSDTGTWWATRTKALTAEQTSAGCGPHVSADSPGELTERIRQQDELTSPVQPRQP